MDPGVVVLRVVVRRRRHVDTGLLAGAEVLVMAGLLGHCATAAAAVESVTAIAAHRTKLHAAWRSRVGPSDEGGRRRFGRIFGFFSVRTRAHNKSEKPRNRGRRQQRTGPYRCSVISKPARPRASARVVRATIVGDSAPRRSPLYRRRYDR